MCLRTSAGRAAATASKVAAHGGSPAGKAAQGACRSRLTWADLRDGRRPDEQRPEGAAVLRGQRQLGGRGQQRLKAVELRAEEVAVDQAVEPAQQRLAARLGACRARVAGSGQTARRARSPSHMWAEARLQARVGGSSPPRPPPFHAGKPPARRRAVHRQLRGARLRHCWCCGACALLLRP